MYDWRTRLFAVGLAVAAGARSWCWPSGRLRLGMAMTGKLVEINMVMGIVNLALIVLAMVLSAAPLPFSDQLGPDALHVVWAAATIFYLVASDFFQVVRLKGYVEFWKMFRGSESSS